MKTKTLLLMLLLAACDQVPQAGNPERDIIVIGNGILNLNESDGVIADIESPGIEGVVSVIVSPQKTESLVRDRATLKTIPTYFDWAASGEKQDPVLKLDIRQEEKKCRYFEPLQNGDLVCRRDLDAFDSLQEEPPVFSERREVFYLDSQRAIHRLYQSKTQKIADDVKLFLVDLHSNV